MLSKKKRITKKEVAAYIDKPNDGFAVRGVLTRGARRLLEEEHFVIVTYTPWVFVANKPENMVSAEAYEKTAHMLERSLRKT